MDITKQQQQICDKYGVKPVACDMDLKVGVALNVKEIEEPINGMRYTPEGSINGWLIWSGEEYSEDKDFFKPLHGHHLKDWQAKVLPYLALPPGWRFLIAENYEDCWFDQNLLDEEQKPTGSFQ